MVMNTVGSASSQDDSTPIRKEALYHGIPYFTTMQGAKAAVEGIGAILRENLAVRSLQEYHAVTGPPHLVIHQCSCVHVYS